MVTYPVRRGKLINFVAHYDSESWTDESWTQSADRAELAQTYRQWNDSLLEMFAVSEQNYKWALYDREPLDRWGDGRLTLIGDTAHAMLPYLAQGAGMTIEDACVLAQHLDGMRDDHAAALRAYERAHSQDAACPAGFARPRQRESPGVAAWAVATQLDGKACAKTETVKGRRSTRLDF